MVPIEMFPYTGYMTVRGGKAHSSSQTHSEKQTPASTGDNTIKNTVGRELQRFVLVSKDLTALRSTDMVNHPGEGPPPTRRLREDYSIIENAEETTTGAEAEFSSGGAGGGVPECITTATPLCEGTSLPSRSSMKSISGPELLEVASSTSAAAVDETVGFSYSE